MFTGLVEATGKLVRREPRGPGFVLVVEGPLRPLTIGESVSVSGACLTVIAAHGGTFEADVSRETVERTTLGGLPLGSLVNLERAVALGQRLGGHLVAGHVDAVGTVRAVDPVGSALRVTLELPAPIARYVAAKGSVAVDGVSLTVNEVRGDSFDLMLIPHTVAATNLSGIRPGRLVNLEADLVARYVVRYLEAAVGGSSAADPSGGARPSDSGHDPEASLLAALRRAGLA